MLSKPLKLKLRAHLDEVNEGYFEHALHAGEYALTFAVLTVTTLIHAVLPFLFVKTGSRTIKRMYKHIEHRSEQPTQ